MKLGERGKEVANATMFDEEELTPLVDNASISVKCPLL
jgi:hypothetical protein